MLRAIPKESAFASCSAMHQTLLKVTRVPTYRNSLLCKIFNSTDCILSLDIMTLTLKMFC